MAIITRKHNGYDDNHRARPRTETREHVGRVLKVRTFHALRNMSDTLDYSDWQTVECTEAYVYLGTTRTDWHGNVVDIPVGQRFAWIDCSNHFDWRGADILIPHVDVGCWEIPEIAEQLTLHEAYKAEQARIAAEQARIAAEQAAAAKVKADAAKAKADAAKAEALKAVPAKGTKVRITRGKHAGKVGVVAWVSGLRVLVKPEEVWQVRRADGDWVNGAQCERA